MTFARSWKLSAKQWRQSSRRWRKTCETLASDLGQLQRRHHQLIAEHAETTGTLDWVFRQHGELLDAVSAIIEAAQRKAPKADPK